jgi:hypothetical protein
LPPRMTTARSRRVWLASRRARLSERASDADHRRPRRRPPTRPIPRSHRRWKRSTAIASGCESHRERPPGPGGLGDRPRPDRSFGQGLDARIEARFARPGLVDVTTLGQPYSDTATRRRRPRAEDRCQQVSRGRSPERRCAGCSLGRTSTATAPGTRLRDTPGRRSIGV